jgi:putative ABC transport system substrate-binding protein
MADMKRRDFMTLVGGAAAAWPLAARAQQAKRIPRIGILLFAKADLAVIDPLLRGLETLGYVDGKTVSLEYRDAGGNYERASQLADEWCGSIPTCSSPSAAISPRPSRKRRRLFRSSWL